MRSSISSGAMMSSGSHVLDRRSLVKRNRQLLVLACSAPHAGAESDPGLIVETIRSSRKASRRTWVSVDYHLPDGTCAYAAAPIRHRDDRRASELGLVAPARTAPDGRGLHP